MGKQNVRTMTDRALKKHIQRLDKAIGRLESKRASFYKKVEAVERELDSIGDRYLRAAEELRARRPYSPQR